jgi:predicted esterase
LYAPFLSAVHEKDTSGRVAILAHAHVGHTPGIGGSTMSEGYFNLDTQIQNTIEAFDAVNATFPAAHIIIVGHSVGAWISLQVMNAFKSWTSPPSDRSDIRF